MQSLKELYKIGKGPSSSHTMGVARAALDFLKKCPNAARYRAVLYGSLALTGKGHLSDEAVLSALAPRRAEVEFNVTRTDLPHPNYMEMCAYDGADDLLLKTSYISVGGGTIAVEGEPAPRAEEVYPFRNFAEIMDYCKKKGKTLGEVAFDFEDAGDYLRNVWRAMCETVERGLSAEGLLPGDLKVTRKAKTLREANGTETPEAEEKRAVCSYAFAAAEENASGGTVVTAPTCGASGVLPAVLYYLRNKHGFSEKEIVAALAAAGMVGVTVKQNASVSGAEAGCQAEIGTATSMAAAAVCSLSGASIEETEYAAEIALEHQLGLTCDPVHGYVQIPCIERNAVAALRALSCAELARVLKGSRKISCDLVVETMYATGKDISERYRETSAGGLARLYRCD